MARSPSGLLGIKRPGYRRCAAPRSRSSVFSPTVRCRCSRVAGRNPHKLLKLMALAGRLNALGVMLGGGGDDDERKLRPRRRAASGAWFPSSSACPLERRARLAGVPRHPALDPRWGRRGRRGAGPRRGAAAAGDVPQRRPLAVLGEVIVNKSIHRQTDHAGDRHRHREGAQGDRPPVEGVRPGTCCRPCRDDRRGRYFEAAPTSSAARCGAGAGQQRGGVKLGYPADVLRNNLMAKQRAEHSRVDWSSAS